MDPNCVNLQLTIEELRKQIRIEQQEKSRLRVKIEELEKQIVDYQRSKHKEMCKL
jgi:uncharacterized protein YlxW (UPF0749 family)